MGEIVIKTELSELEFLGKIGETVIQKIKESQQPEPVTKYLTQTEVCTMLQISKPTLIELRKSGQIKFTRIAETKNIRFLESDVIEFMKNKPDFKYSRK